MNIIALSDQQLHHFLAGLRALQRLHHCADLDDIATNGGEVEALSLEQLDDLAEALNTGTLAPTFSQSVAFHFDKQVTNEPELDVYRDAADKLSFVREGECEVDSNALVSKGEDAGAYVMAWVWVDDEDIG